MAVDESLQTFDHPLYSFLGKMPGLSIAMTTADVILTWGLEHSLWAFPMATSCCGIEFMATMTSRFDMDQFGTFTRPVPRQSDVFIVSGTVTVKMAPRVKKLWDQMPEPKWCLAMGSCAISGDLYRDIYSVVPGVDTFIPVDVYVPGCPPAPDHLHMGMHKLAEMIRLKRAGKFDIEKHRAERPVMIEPSIPRIGDPNRPAALDAAQLERTLHMHTGSKTKLPGQAVDLGEVGFGPLSKKGD